METVCRVCMLSSGAMLNIFDGSEESVVSTVDIVSQFMGFEVRRGDTFPETICPLCLQDARSAFDRKQAINEHHKLETQVKEEESAGEDLLEEEVCRISDCERETPSSAENDHLHKIAVKQEENDEDLPQSSHQMHSHIDFKVKNERIEEDPLEEGTYEGQTEESNSDEDSNAFDYVVKEEEEEDEEENGEDNSDSKQSFKCPHCSSSYTRKSSLNAHIRTHTGERPYRCSHCPQSFTVKRQLHDHIRIHTGERPYKCKQCEKSFRKRTDLRLHARTHLEVRPFQCSQCSMSFVRKYRLVSHTRIHTGERPFQCLQCPKNFVTNAGLQSHVNSHVEERSHQCCECPKSFKNRGNLQQHMRTHAAELLKCPYCPKSFVHPSSLRTHTLLHSTERPYECHVCSTAFTLPRGLRRHMKTDCYKKLIQCPQCPTSFRLPEMLREHFISHHPETPLETIAMPPERPHKCTVCSAAFIDQRSLRRHMKRNCYKKLNHCLQCSISFDFPEMLREHIILVHPLTPIINTK